MTKLVFGRTKWTGMALSKSHPHYAISRRYYTYYSGPGHGMVSKPSYTALFHDGYIAVPRDLMRDAVRDAQKHLEKQKGDA